MLRQLFVVLFLLAVYGLFGNVTTVTAQQSIFEIVGPPPMLHIKADVNGRLMPAVDQRSQLRWQPRAAQPTKITVQTTASGQTFSLTVEAKEVDKSEGLAAPPVKLRSGRPPVDFISGVPSRSSGSRFKDLWSEANLKYTAAATLKQGAGFDEHIVIYTLVAQ